MSAPLSAASLLVSVKGHVAVTLSLPPHLARGWNVNPSLDFPGVYPYTTLSSSNQLFRHTPESCPAVAQISPVAACAGPASATLPASTIAAPMILPFMIVSFQLLVLFDASG